MNDLDKEIKALREKLIIAEDMLEAFAENTEKLIMSTDDKLQCPIERRHLELMAATLPIEALEPLAWEDCKESVSEIEAELARRRVRMARAIQAEVAKGADNG